MNQDAKYYKEFVQLYSEISNETDRNRLEAHMDEAGRWRMNWEFESGDLNLPIAEQLWSILYDQTARRHEQLRRKPGRQIAVNWIQELKRHENRLELELGVLRQLNRGQADVDMCIALIADSMTTTIKVIGADRGQIDRTIEDGSLVLTTEQETLLQASTKLTEQAADWLSTYRAD